MGNWLSISDWSNQLKSIRAKLWLAMMGFAAFIMLFLWLFQVVFLNSYYTIFVIEKVKSQAKSIIENIEQLENLEQLNQNEDIINQLDQFVYQQQVSLEIYDEDAKIVYQNYTGSNSIIPGGMHDIYDTVYQNASLGTETSQIFTHPKYGNEIKVIGIPFSSLRENQLTGVFMIIMPLAAVEETVTILKSQLVLLSVILLIAALVLSFFVSRKMAKPISEITKQADYYAKGDYGKRIEQPGQDEIGKLAMQMNQMGDALMRNDILQKELIANISHELRTPLTLIKGYAETIRDITGNNPEKREKQLGIIITETERLSHMVSEILDFSKLQADVKTLKLESFSLTDLLCDLKNHFELGSFGHSLSLDELPTEDFMVVADKSMIQQVFYNLIGNAYKFSGENKSVEIRMQDQKDTITIQIKDYGVGISEDQLPYVFDRFYQVPLPDGEKQNGTGLGLAIVKRILQLHNSSFGVESKKNQGSTFWFTLKKEDSHKSF